MAAKDDEGFTTDTSKLQLLTHQAILDIGESIKQKYENEAEYDKQCAIRATEEVVRREEKKIQQQLLEKAKEEWKIERQKLIEDLEKEKQESIELEKVALEKKLKDQFDVQLGLIQQSHDDHLKEAVSKTWSQAEVVKDKLVNTARQEERKVALDIASETASKVKKEKEEMEIQFENAKQKALNDQKELLDMENQTKQLLLEQELQLTYEQKLGEVCENYESELQLSQQLLDEENSKLKTIQEQLNRIQYERDEWKLKYNRLKTEFSDFIAQFPGFNADFLLQ